jgi:hypothetical protein
MMSSAADNPTEESYAPCMNRKTHCAAFFLTFFALAFFTLAFLAASCTIAAQEPAGAGGSVGVAPPSLTIRAYTSPAPIMLSAADLTSMPHIAVSFHNSHTNADETYSGIRLADILAKLKAPLGSELRGPALASYVVATGSDGYKVVLALAEVDPSFHPGEVIVADEMNGKPLDAHNGPLKLVVTEDKRPARSVRNLVTIELKTL